jgi:acyl-CoA thioester hydrolase
VVDARCTYKSPATYDDIVNIETVLVEMGNTSLVFGYSIHRDSTVIATGQTTHVFTDRNGKLIKMPPEIREKLSF